MANLSYIKKSSSNSSAALLAQLQTLQTANDATEAKQKSTTSTPVAAAKDVLFGTAKGAARGVSEMLKTAESLLTHKVVHDDFLGLSERLYRAEANHPSTTELVVPKSIPKVGGMKIGTQELVAPPGAVRYGFHSGCWGFQ